MNITQENIDQLNAIVKINLEPTDYQPKVDEVIKKLKRTATIPGFRPGMVPAGVIKKMYGKSVLVDELNKILSESLSKYIYDNKIDIIGSPLPKTSEEEQEWEEGKNFEFLYELGLSPSFDLNISKNNPVDFYEVMIDDKMVEEDLNDMRRRYGKFSNPETSEAQHILYGEFEELDEQGNVKEGGIKTTTTIALEMIKDEKFLAPFIGIKKDEAVNFNPMKTMGNESEVAAMLKIDKHAMEMNSNYRFTVKTINQIDKADLNQEFFDKIYGEGNVKSEDEFRHKIREGIAKMFVRESDRKLKKDLRSKLLNELSIPLPDDFLKRMVKANAKKEELEEHDFDHEYFHLAEDLRWSIIQNKIFRENNMQISDEEIKIVARQLIRQQFSQYGMNDLGEEKLNEISERYLNEEGNQNKIERSLVDQKVFEYLKNFLTLNIIQYPYEEFVKKLNEKTEHEMEHHH